MILSTLGTYHRHKGHDYRLIEVDLEKRRLILDRQFPRDPPGEPLEEASTVYLRPWLDEPVILVARVSELKENLDRWLTADWYPESEISWEQWEKASGS